MVPALDLALAPLPTGTAPATPEAMATVSTAASILVTLVSEGLGWNGHYFTIYMYIYRLVIEGVPMKIGSSTLASTRLVLLVGVVILNSPELRRYH